MSWLIKRSPFRRDEDPVEHMANLLANEAIKAGSPLSVLEKEILIKEYSIVEPMPEELRERAKQLIARIFEGEPWDEFDRTSKGFSSSLEWADGSRSNIAVLAHEVACEVARLSPPPHGWGLVKDKLQLVGCAVLFIVIIGASIAAIQALFGWK